MKTRFWNSNWFTGLVITLIFLLFSESTTLQGLERSAYDWGVRSTERLPSDKVAVIAIDDESIANLGRWPWPRDIHAEMISMLSAGGAKVIGQGVFYLEPQIDPGQTYIEELIRLFSSSSLAEAPVEIDILSSLLESSEPATNTEILEFFRQSSLVNRFPQDLESMASKLLQAESALDTDSKLAASMAEAQNTVLAMPFILGQPRGKPDQDLPDYVLKNALQTIHDRVSAQSQGLYPYPSVDAISPIPLVGAQASAIGHLNTVPDVDGAIRTEPLVLQYYDQFFPSMSLMIAAKSLNLDSGDIRINLAESVELGGLLIKTDRELQMNTFFYNDIDGFPAFPVDSFFDVLQGKIPLDKYQGKIVLVGPTATGVGTTQVTPIDPAMAPVLALAHSVSSILNEDFFIVPEWAIWVRIAAFVLVALYLMTLMPRFKAALAAGVTSILLIAFIITHFTLMTGSAMWIPLMTPAALLVLGHLLITTKRFFLTERGKLKSDTESAESNRMLGLAFQGQGQLDMAFEKFRKCPMDESIMEVLYNLALDYERKRQFNKASNVYQYMAKYDIGFRDLKTRLERSQAMEETVILGGAGGTTAGGTLMMAGGGVEKPMLGRYEVEKELGKGAMGIVYLGKDPKISRVVAIKTMALSQEFEDDELVEVKERFFREAETAGRLSHPNIVTIFDAGEEHDLAYIAMEFLKGKDLAAYTKAENLLPVDKVLDIILRSADGLHYAHQQNVVHRDIKPANIMYEPESDSLKITDFGIARITDSSKTKTGMVLGTPSYMSPEQLAGKKVDGRSDLFSLGVMMYQMLTGTLPFTADSMATLMFKITNDEHPDITTARADLSPCVKAIIDKALAKDVEKRYQSGAEMVADLRACE